MKLYKDLKFDEMLSYRIKNMQAWTPKDTLEFNKRLKREWNQVLRSISEYDDSVIQLQEQVDYVLMYGEPDVSDVLSEFGVSSIDELPWAEVVSRGLDRDYSEMQEQLDSAKQSAIDFEKNAKNEFFERVFSCEKGSVNWFEVPVCVCKTKVQFIQNESYWALGKEYADFKDRKKHEVVSDYSKNTSVFDYSRSYSDYGIDYHTVDEVVRDKDRSHSNTAVYYDHEYDDYVDEFDRNYDGDFDFE